LVVVPDVEHDTVVAADGRFGIDDTGMTRTDEISGNNFLRIDEVDLLLQVRVHGHLTQVLVDLVATGGFLQVQVENRHGDVGRRHADRIAGQLALEHRQRLGRSGGGTGLGDDHVQRGAATTTTALVEVVDQVLVVGVGVNGLDVAVDDTVLVVDRLEHRHDGVGGAGSRGDDLVVGGDFAMVDAMHDVLQLALARRGQYHAGNAWALEVLAEAFGVAPLTGVVHQQRVLDAVLGVVHRGRIVGVDHLDQVAVGSDGVVFSVDMDGAVERTMYRIAAQQAGALDQVIVGALAHDDGAQAQAVAATGLLDQDTCQQATNTAEAVEHHVSAFVTGSGGALVRHFGELFANELLECTAIAFGLELAYQLAQVDRSGAQVHFAHGLEDRVGLVDRQFRLVGLTVASEAMRLENGDHRAVDQATAVDGSHHVVITVQLTNQRNHRFGERFAVNPFTKTLVGLLSHGQFLPTCRG